MSRKRWIYIDGEALEVSPDYQQPKDEAKFRVVNDRHYDGLRATDGTNISTRKRHREYMKRNGLTTMDDYTETWKQDAKQREKRMQGIDPNRKRDIAEAMQRLEHGPRR